VAWRGSARAATMAPSQGKAPMTRRQGTTPTSTRSRRGEGQATRDIARGRHGRDPRHRRQRSRGHRGDNRPDLSDRQECRREIYRLAPISAANSNGGRWNQARLRRGDAVARARARGRREASEGERPPGRVRPGRPAPTGEPGPTGGPG
jgi:hypothetical protein